MTSVIVSDTTNLYNIAVQEENTVLNITISGGAVGGGGTSVHSELIGLQGGQSGQYYHLNASRSTEADAFLNGGTSTHIQLDSEKSASEAHRGDQYIHFYQEDIDHTLIDTNGSLYTHNEIDNHIDDSFKHVPSQTGHANKALKTDGTNTYWDTISSGLNHDEVVNTFNADGKILTEVYKLSGTTLKTITRTYDSLKRLSTISDGTSTWTFTYNSNGRNTRRVKT